MKKIKVSNCGECEVLNYDQNADWPSKEGLLKSIIITEKEKNKSLEAENTTLKKDIEALEDIGMNYSLKCKLLQRKLDKAMKYLKWAKLTVNNDSFRSHIGEKIKEIESLEKIKDD